MRRRDLLSALGAVAGLLSLPRRALALGPKTAFTIGRLVYDGEWNPRPNAVRRILALVSKATSVEVADAPDDLKADDEAIFEHPFLVLSGAGEFPSFTAKQKDNLGRYLRFGGFLLVDNASGEPDGAFDRGFRRFIAELIPEAKLDRLDDDHSIFRSFFLINRVMGRIADRNYLEGITLGDWTPVVYMSDDLGGAIERDPFGNYRFDVTPGPDDLQRSWASRLAVNLVLYALTVNYKKDQIHVEAILRRRRH